MPQSVSPSPQRPDRRQRILDLSRNLIDDLEAVALDEIDGEFYWRICRDDLLNPLSELAESIAPHIVDPARRNEQFDEEQQQAIDKFRQRLIAIPGDVPDEWQDQFTELRLDLFKKDLKANELFREGQQFTEKLPGFVWEHYSMRRRIPMRAPMTITPTERGTALEIRISSRGVTGDDLDAFVSSNLSWYEIIPEPPPFSPEGDDRIMQDIKPQPVTQVSLQIDFKLVTEPLASSSTEPSEDRADPPYVQMIVWWPLPPPRVIGNAYESIVRNQQQWHQELSGSDTVQDKEVAVRTWGVGLLMRAGATFGRALRELEPVFGSINLSQEADRQARNRLFDRVPEARFCLGAR